MTGQTSRAGTRLDACPPVRNSGPQERPLHAPLPAAAAGAALAGAGATTFDTYWKTVLQQRVGPRMLARTTAFSATGAYAVGAAGFALIGPIAGVVGAAALLGLAAGYATLSSAVVMTWSATRSITWREPPVQAETLRG